MEAVTTSTNSTTKQSSLSVNFKPSIFNFVYQIQTSIKNWFNFDYINSSIYDESKELIQRYMLNQSWFDKFSSLWSRQYISSKILLILSAILFAGIFGPMPAMFTALLTLTIHILLQSHEDHRKNLAKIFAEESANLNQQLRDSQKLLDTKISDFDQQLQSIKIINDNIVRQTNLLEEENNKIKLQTTQIIQNTSSLDQANTLLATRQQQVEKALTNIDTDLKHCATEISNTKNILSEFQDSVSSFTQIVHDTQNNQTRLSQSTEKFCFFVQAKLQAHEGDNHNHNDDPPNDELLRTLTEPTELI